MCRKYGHEDSCCIIFWRKREQKAKRKMVFDGGQYSDGDSMYTEEMDANAQHLKRKMETQEMIE